jgi:drug/metabolite transporter (DMT)-like permease
MSNFDFGLSNPYLKFGMGIILFGAALIVVASVLGASDTIPNLLIIGLVLLMAGAVVYVIGRLVKAASRLRK